MCSQEHCIGMLPNNILTSQTDEGCYERVTVKGVVEEEVAVVVVLMVRVVEVVLE